MNRVVLFGRLGADAELRTTTGGHPVLKLRLATTERVKRGDKFEDQTEWHSVTMWGKRAKGLAEYLVKGCQVLITGRLHTSEYVDRNQEKRYSTEVIADELEFGASKRAPASTTSRDDDEGYPFP